MLDRRGLVERLLRGLQVNAGQGSLTSGQQLGFFLQPLGADLPYGW